MRRLVTHSSILAIAALIVVAAAPPATAQLNTQHLKGAVGLKSGSMPPPHVYVIAPLLFVYSADAVRNMDGVKFPGDAEITTVAFAGGVNVVTTKKFLGADYGFQVLFPVGANNRIQGTEIDQNPGGGLTDSVISPVTLGWHFKSADVLAGYTIFVPTGRYSDGATDNTGFGMWGHELQIGTTVFFAEKKYHAATLASFDFQSKKEDSETQVGDVMNLEGGFGADFLKGGLTVGLDYYASFKLTSDHIEGVPDILIRGKNRVFALGPEVQLALARKGTLYGFLKLAYQWETYARTNLQGSVFVLTTSFLVKPIKLP